MPATVTPEALAFTVLFQRWEYALKTMKYATNRRSPKAVYIPDGGTPGGYRQISAAKASPNHDLYLNERLPLILARSGDAPFAEAFGYLLAQPPLTQVRDGAGNVCFAHLRNPTSFRSTTCTYPLRADEILLALEAIKTVRNNAFHGGKAMGPPDCERDRLLLVHGAALLRLVIGVDRQACAIVNETVFIEVGEVAYLGA